MTRIHPSAQIDPGAQIADGVEIGPYCVIGAEVILSAGVCLDSHVVLQGPLSIGEGVIVHAFAALGGPAQINSPSAQVGSLEIGAGCIIREHVTVNRGSAVGLGVTRIGRDCLFMAQAHVGHDCQVGDGVVMAQAATLGGHCEIGPGVTFGGLCAVHQRSRVGRLAMIGGLTGVVGDIIPFGLAAGHHARLAGLNRIGLRRSGASAALIKTLGSVYTALFHEEGLFQERVDFVARVYGETPEALEIVQFIHEARRRPLCKARPKWQSGPGLE